MHKSHGVYKIVAVVFLLATTLSAFAQDVPDYITYPKVTGKLSSKRPTFNDNVVVGFTFDGPLVADTDKTLLKLGITHFLRDHCKAREVEICVSLEIGPPTDGSDASYSSGNGRKGGGWTQASFNGKMYPVSVVISIVHQPGDATQNTLMIAQSTEIAAVGSGMESMGSYGANGSGVFTISSTTGLNAEISNAIRKDLINLLGGRWSRGLRLDLISPWTPGADQYVAQAFAPKAEPQQMMTAQTQTKQVNELDSLQQ